jgi:glucose/arabinose dehydrogenase
VLRRLIPVVILLGLLAPAAATAGVKATPVATLSAPTYITAPPGDTHRVFVVQQSGQIMLIKDGAAPTTFMDISSEVKFVGGEQGLLSMAFAPDYATSHRFYVYYTSACPNVGCDEHVSEFTANANGDSAAPSSEHVLLTIPHPNQSNHNGGQLQFGPDDDLYISVGDGGGGDDTEQNAQHTDRLLGKILRIAPGATSYSIPAGNPFAGSPLCVNGTNGGANCPEVWAYGLRNPWRFSFDSATGDMVIGDVGQSAEEEIDYAHPGQNAGANYGWPCFEGTGLDAARPPSECTPLPSNAVAPVLTYPHPANCGSSPFCGAGIIGGYVMHDPRLPSLNGCYVFGDLSTPALRVVRLAQPAALGAAPLGPQIGSLSSFGQDAAGHVYAADIASGVVYRLDPDGNAATNPTCPPAPGSPLPPVQTKPPAGGKGNVGGTSSGSPRHRKPAPPRLTALKLLPAQFRAARSGHSVHRTSRRGALVSFHLNERATVTFVVQRARSGHRGWRAVAGSFRVTRERGTRRLRFTGRIGGHALAQGRYRLVARAHVGTGRPSAPARARFEIHR